MKRCLSAAVATAAAIWLSGCGGGGGGNNNPPPPVDQFTRAVVNVDWPDRSRNIGATSSALSMVITIKGSKSDGTDYVWTINRDVTAAAATKRYVSPTAEVKVGSWDVTIKLYAQADGQGAVVGTAAAHVPIASDGTGIDTLVVTGVVSTVEVPDNQHAPLNSKVDLIFTAKDSTGNIVAVTPGSAIWKVTAGADKLQFVSGQAQAIANGSATVTATVDGKTSAPATVVCGATTGTLVVNAKDASGALIKNVTVTVQILQGGTQVNQLNTTTGTVTFNNVPPGQTDIKVTVTGYQPGSATATVVVGNTVTQDVSLVQDGTLIVNAKDPTGSLIAGATITLLQGGVQVAQQTTATGTQTFANLAPGATDITVTSTAFHDGSGSAVVVSGQTVTANVSLVPRGKPQASTSATRQTALNGNVATIQVDIAVNDEFGQPITTLAPGAFVVPPVTNSTATYTFTQQSVQLLDIPPAGPYSAFLALDASDSVQGNDPSGSRIQAVKTFFSALGAGDNAAFGYFPAGPNGNIHLASYPSAFDATLPYIGFVNDGSKYYPYIDGLSKKTYAGTPLYNATNEAINYVNGLATNANRAVVVFTDGLSTGETLAQRQQMIDNAKAKNVKVYTVGLGPGTDTNELALIAQQTGGTVMYASDATQLVSFYRTLSSLLTGSGKFYRTTWTITKSSGNFVVGENFTAISHITLQDSTVLNAPFYVEIH